MTNVLFLSLFSLFLLLHESLLYHFAQYLMSVVLCVVPLSTFSAVFHFLLLEHLSSVLEHLCDEA